MDELNLDDVWADNELQFARLICEIAAVEPNMEPLIALLAEQMNLEEEYVYELFARAGFCVENKKKHLVENGK